MCFIQAFHHHFNHSFTIFYCAGIENILPQQNDVFQPSHWIEMVKCLIHCIWGRCSNKRKSVQYALDNGRLSSFIPIARQSHSKKALEIANKMVQEGYEEGRAIPIAINQAKEWKKNATEKKWRTFTLMVL